MMHHRSVDIDTLKVFYREAGDRANPSLLLLHGFPTSSHMFRHLMPLLASDFHVIAPDLPGFGFSDAPPRTEFNYTFDNLARVMEAFVEKVALTRFGLYVFDHGAPVGLRLALARPERVTSLISQGGNLYEEGLSENWDPVMVYWRQPSDEAREGVRMSMLTAASVMRQYTSGVADESLIAPEAYALDLSLLQRPGNEEVQLDLLLNYFSNLLMFPRIHEYLRDRKPPTLVIWGRNDPVFRTVGAEAFRRDNVAAEVHFLDTGHFALETHLAEVADRIKAFLRERICG